MEKIVVIFVCTLVIATTFVSADNNVQNIVQNTPYKQDVSSNRKYWSGVWEVEYDDSLWADSIVVDSMNNVILVGAGGNGNTEFSYAVIVKYSADGKLMWSDHQTAPIIPGLISELSVVNDLPQSTENVSGKQINLFSKTPDAVQYSMGSDISSDLGLSCIANEFMIGSHRYIEPIFTKAQSLLWGKWVRFYDVAVDDNDDIVVVGEIQNRFTKDLRTVYVIKYDPNGNVLWDRIYRRYWLTPRDLATGVAIDSNNNIFVSVISQEKDSESYKGWILKLSSNNGATLDEVIYPEGSIIFSDLAVDYQDNVYVSGYYTPSGKMIVTKYSNELTLLDEWGPNIMPIRPIAIDVDQDGNVIVAGGIGFYGNEKQYLTKFSPDGTILWSNKSKDVGVWYDVISLNPEVTATAGISWNNETYGRFYIGLFNESGKEFKRFLGGNKTILQCFFSHGLDVDNNGDIVVGGFRWYGRVLYFMYAMKFYQ